MKNGKMVVKNDLVELEADVINKHSDISNIDTPKYYVKQQQGFDYVDEAYMRHLLNTHYPIWKWEIVKYEFIGDNGVERHFDSVDAHRIASNQKGYVDIGNDLKSANTDCFKVAVNRLCNIADDVYRKRIEDITLDSDQKKTINSKLKELKDESIIKKIKLGIERMTINKTNYDKTIEKINKYIGD